MVQVESSRLRLPAVLWQDTNVSEDLAGSNLTSLWRIKSWSYGS